MKLKLCEIVQQLEYIDLDKVEEVLNGRECIRDYAYIIHGKDKDDKGNLKAPHIHIALRLKDAYDTKYISQWFGVSENYVSKVKGRWTDMLKYLTHENAPGKYQYDKEDVVSNFDWQGTIAKVSKSERLLQIIEGIDNGTIREYNYFNHITMDEYTNYKNKIELAFKYRIDRLKGMKRDMECIYITGESGAGKTTMAKEMAEERGLSYFVSSGSNDVLDGYQGEDCIILDDLRPSCMGLSDLLKMLDNNTASTVKSRYKNKVLECKLIIVTTVLPLEEFFSHVFENEDEPVVQLKRRCKVYIKLTSDSMQVGIWQPKSKIYTWLNPVPNPVIDKYDVKDKSEEEILEAVSSLGSFFTGYAKASKDSIEEQKFIDMSDSEYPF